MAAQGGQLAVQGVAGWRVHRRKRLVQQQHTMSAGVNRTVQRLHPHQRAGQRHALLLPAGQLRRQAVLQTRKAQAGEQRHQLLVILASSLCGICADSYVFDSTHVRE